MTTAADDFAVEDAFEALLAGRPAPGGAAGLAAFTEAVRTSATSPGRPNAALADLLASGLLVDQSSPSAQTARSAGSPSGSRNRIRRRTAMFFPALLAKILSAGAVAQAATGATVVVVAFAGAGAAGVLPGPVQDTFTTIVSDEVPVVEETPVEGAPVEEAPIGEIPVEEVPVEEVPIVEEPVVEEPVVEEPVVDAGAAVIREWLTAPIEGSFGSWVSAARHDPVLRAAIEDSGHNFGYFVSWRAHHKDMTEEDLAEAGVYLDELSEDGSGAPEDGTAEDDAEQQTADDSDHRGNGNGNGRGGHGNGRGNGGNDHDGGRGNGHGNGRN